MAFQYVVLCCKIIGIYDFGLPPPCQFILQELLDCPQLLDSLSAPTMAKAMPVFPLVACRDPPTTKHCINAHEHTLWQWLTYGKLPFFKGKSSISAGHFQ